MSFNRRTFDMIYLGLLAILNCAFPLIYMSDFSIPSWAFVFLVVIEIFDLFLLEIYLMEYFPNLFKG